MSFDDMCRLIASPASRRDVFKAIFGGLAAAALPGAAKASKPPHVKSFYIRVTARDARTCNFKFFTRIKNVKCPPNTVKEIDAQTGPTPNPNPLCQQRITGSGKKRKIDYIGEAYVRCVRQPTSPS